MKAILIDPATKTVNVVNVQSVSRATSMFFSERPRPALRLPRGDVLLASAAERNAFLLGGSRPIGGPGLIVGRRRGAGEHGPVLVELDHVAQMVHWTTIEKADDMTTPTMVRVIEIDPERRSIEEMLIPRTMLALQHRFGGEIKLSFRAPGADLVFAAANAAASQSEWRKDDATFTDRCIVVGHDSRSGRLVDVAASLANLRESVCFRTQNDSDWTSWAN
ncbi:hypothetical protein [Bradyrhizobium sp.]|uniref:hypothetical protein n=1 Tax=Bradyrhizobium sp. TaxID=376 RepID=UPI0007C87F20|nr:hypothetical protein [Bradyrhizobium sp.]